MRAFPYPLDEVEQFALMFPMFRGIMMTCLMYLNDNYAHLHGGCNVLP